MNFPIILTIISCKIKHFDSIKQINKNIYLKTKKDITVYGAVLNGDDIRNISLQKNGIIIIGNESRGIRADILPYIQHAITIPKFGNAESLNATVATGIILDYFRRDK